MMTVYRPELLYVDGGFVAGEKLVVDAAGRVVNADAKDADVQIMEMPGKALVPGFVNAHSHSFQRLIRGKSESRVTSGRDFWSWRGTMYHAASQLDPEQVYDVARMAFLEMVLAGTTTVGEFHYLHNAPEGRPYADANLLAKQVLAAAESVGIRIVLLRTAYLRAGFELPPDARQMRFYESSDAFVKNMEALLGMAQGERVHFGVAPHSVRAVPLPELREIVAWTRAHKLPLHMHVAEQVAENDACVREYGATPVKMLAREGILGLDFTAAHGVHVTAEEIAMLAESGATVCSCPTTERNLGDGFVRADEILGAGIRIALGSDSQAQIDPLEDARELEYHLRLQQQKRAMLDQVRGKALAAQLFECATVSGARALGVATGELKAGALADFFTVDLGDVSIAGNSGEDLLPMLVFSLSRMAIRDVVVGGQFALRDGVHAEQEAIVSRYRSVYERVWAGRA
jgi:formimidoylglutamate deiminase